MQFQFLFSSELIQPVPNYAGTKEAPQPFHWVMTLYLPPSLVYLIIGEKDMF